MAKKKITDKQYYKFWGAIAIIGIILIAWSLYRQRLVNEFPPLYYCEQDSDCLTSCGPEIGRGSCYNKAFVGPGNPPDNVCCLCENCQPCVTCECISNVCVTKDAEGNCC